MHHRPFQLRQCERPSCHFRFPVTDDRQPGECCPHCGARTSLVGLYPRLERPYPTSRQNGVIVHALLDNIRSVYNVGAICRTADGAGIGHLYLCGITPPPDHPRAAKTALGAEQIIAWTQHRNGLETAVSLKEHGHQLWALEGAPQADILWGATFPTANAPIVLVIGNEIAGIDPEILEQCQRILYIPMQGQKTSLNVATAFGVAAYAIRYRLYPLPAAK